MSYRTRSDSWLKKTTSKNLQVTLIDDLVGTGTYLPTYRYWPPGFHQSSDPQYGRYRTVSSVSRKIWLWLFSLFSRLHKPWTLITKVPFLLWALVDLLWWWLSCKKKNIDFACDLIDWSLHLHIVGAVGTVPTYLPICYFCYVNIYWSSFLDILCCAKLFIMIFHCRINQVKCSVCSERSNLGTCRYLKMAASSHHVLLHVQDLLNNLAALSRIPNFDDVTLFCCGEYSKVPEDECPVVFKGIVSPD